MASGLSRGEFNEDFGQGFQKEFEARHGSREQTINHFDITSAQGSLGWSSGHAMGFYKLCRCNFKDKHTRVRKHQHKHMI
jgi:hypothetical protein